MIEENPKKAINSNEPGGNPETAKILKWRYMGKNDTYDQLYDLLLDKPVEAPGYTKKTRILRVGLIQGQIWAPQDPRTDNKNKDTLTEIPVTLK